jgi:hypothetical protein
MSVSANCDLILKCFKSKRSKRSSAVLKADVDEETMKRIGRMLFNCYHTKSESPVIRPECYYTYIGNTFAMNIIVEIMMKNNSENEIPKSYFNPKTFVENMYFMELFSSKKLEIESI